MNILMISASFQKLVMSTVKISVLQDYVCVQMTQQGSFSSEDPFIYVIFE